MVIAKIFTVCENIARKCLKTENIQTNDFTVVRLQNQNFLVKITVNNGSTEKTLNLFAKSTSNGNITKINRIMFEDFQKTIKKFDPTITPKLYHHQPGLLVFDDLTWQGFQTSRSNHLNLEHIQVVLATLAKLHAASFAYEEIKSKELGKSYRLNQEYKLVHSNVNLKEDEVAKLISSLVGKSEEKLTKHIQGLEQTQLSPKFRKTLCHSNLILENIMFKCKDGVPVECKLINFSPKAYAPPMYDVLQLIFFNTTEHLRQHHLDTLLAHYHECIKKELKEYCVGIEEILTTEDLQLSVNHLLPLIKLETVLRTQNQNNKLALEEALQGLKETITWPVLTREDCYTIIKNKMGTTNYDFLSFTGTPLDQITGFLGEYHKLKIKIRHLSQDKTIDCFVKCVPKGGASKEMVEAGDCFSKEAFIYQTLVPEMRKLGINTITECQASCYFQRFDDVMVFEDISSLNYRTLPSQIPFDFELLSLTIRKVAKFHASMFVFEEKMSEKLGKPYRVSQEYGSYLHEVFFLRDQNHSGGKVMQAGLKSIPDVIDLFPDIKTEKNQEDFRKLWPTLKELFFDLIKTSERFRNVLCHGDLWTNNIMVQVDGDKPIDCYFVDYQCTRYCPPAHDFLSVMYLTTDRSTRMKHEEQIKGIYYDELAKNLGSYGYDIGEIYPHGEFEESINYIKPQMVMQAIMYNQFCMCTPEEISTILSDERLNRAFMEDRKEYLVTMYDKSLVMRNKLRECILDLYDLCDCMYSSV